MWRDSIIEEARSHPAFAPILAVGCNEPRAIHYAVSAMKEAVAERVRKELIEDSDPPALWRAQARLSLLTAFLTTSEDPCRPDMTPEEIAAARKWEASR